MRGDDSQRLVRVEENMNPITYLSYVYFVPRTVSGPEESQIAMTQF